MEKREIQRQYLQPSLDDFKSHVRVTASDLDGELEANLMAAIRSSERYIGKVIALSKFTLNIPFSHSITLRPPVAEVTSVTVDGEPLPADSYALSGRILTISEDVTGEKVEVAYIAGMNEVEPDIRIAVLLSAARLFNNPGDVVEALPTKSSVLLRSHRSWGLDDD